MLKSIRLQNFQSHEDTVVYFAPTVTAIVGLNNHGKSAVFRALKKVVRNEPEGTTFIRDGQKQCEITVTTDAGSVIRRVRSDGASDANMYVANGTEFAKFGKTGIPEEVKAVLGVSDPQQFGDIEFDLNFQDQLEPLFLVVGQGLASVRGKVLGKITGVDAVQRAIQYGAAEERETLRKYEQAKQQRDLLTEELKAYAYVSELETQLQELKVLEEACTLLGGTVQHLQELVLAIEQCVARAIVVTEQLESVSLSFDTDLLDVERLLMSASTLAELHKLATRLGYLDTALASIPDFDFTEIEESLHWYALVSVLLPQLEDVSARGGEVEKQLQLIDGDILSSHAAVVALEQELGVCPVCERVFS